MSVIVDFGDEIDATAFNGSNVTMQSTAGIVPLTINYAQKRLTLTPKSPLALDTEYLVTIKGGLTSVGGRTLAADFTVRFKTEHVHWERQHLTNSVSGADGDIVLFDVDGDGLRDVVRLVDSQTGYPSLVMNRQHADGTLAATATLATALPNCSWRALAVGDLNGDGEPDLVTLSSDLSGGDDGVCGLEIFTRDGSGGLVRGPAHPSGPAAGQLRIADLNGDGRDDAVAVDFRGGLRLWYQTANGGIADVVAMPNSGLMDLQVGDLNGDGLVDLIGLVGTAQVVIRYQLAGGGFAEPTYISVPVDSMGVPGIGVDGVAIGDVDGDGRNDLVATFGGNSPSARVITYLQAADGTLQAQPSTIAYDVPTAVLVADIDADGHNDILVAHTGWEAFGVIYRSLTGSAAGEYVYNFQSFQNIESSRAIAVGDLGNDGLPDVLLNTGGELIVFRQTR